LSILGLLDFLFHRSYFNGVLCLNRASSQPASRRVPALACKSGTQGRQPLNILFKFRQLVFAIHIDHQFKKICSLMQFAGLFITLDQQIPSAACPQLIARSFGNGLAGLATGDGIAVALLK
jgi:hypothetical protein